MKRALIVNATAGSGKTTTIVDGLGRVSGIKQLKYKPSDEQLAIWEWLKNELCSEDEVIVCAFSHAIATELKERLTFGTATTIHSLGCRIMRENGIRIGRPDTWKTANLYQQFCQVKNVKELSKAQRAILDDVRELVKYCKDAVLTEDDITESSLAGLAIDNEYTFSSSASACELPVKYVLEEGSRLPVREERKTSAFGKAKPVKGMEIDFDDMIYLPARYGWKIKADCIITDECQDLSPGKLKLIANQDCTSFVFVGDPCQPTGTNVAVVRGKGGRGVKARFSHTRIENISKGDDVVSYTASDCAFVQNGRKVLGVTKKKYKGMLVCVDTTNGLHSEYTPSHHCFANFVKLRSKYAVYVMKRGNNYRVGKAKMSYGESGSGPFARAKSEGADALWILDVFDTDKEALIAEGAVAGKFGLPELGFKDPNNNGKNQEDIDAAWQFIGNNASRAIECLIFFGRMFQYPLWTDHNNYSSMKRPMVVRACNLLNGAAVLPYTGECHVSTKEWVTISVTRRKYSGYVYSLSVDKEKLYVADGIVTHNCQAIFAFAGAQTDSFSKIAEAMDEVEVLPLSYTYRCGKAIVAEAQKIVGDAINAGSTNPDGEIVYLDEADMDLQQGDMLVSRVNAPLMSLAWKLVKAGKPCQVVGRSIGAGLVKLINKLTDKQEVDSVTLCQLLEDWRDQQIKLLQTKKYDTESRQIAIGDQADCITTVATNCKTSGEVVSFIQQIFNDSDVKSIRLSSIHRAKGLEADNVYFFNPKNVPHVLAKTAEAKKQEWNLKFVAITRAIHKLVYVRIPEKEVEV